MLCPDSDSRKGLFCVFLKAIGSVAGFGLAKAEPDSVEKLPLHKLFTNTIDPSSNCPDLNSRNYDERGSHHHDSNQSDSCDSAQIRRSHYEKTISLSAEYADRNQALVLGTQGYYYPCHCPHGICGLVGKIEFHDPCGS